MKWARRISLAFLIFISVACLLAPLITHHSYAEQFRGQPDAAPSQQHLLGTDDLGRDRLARLLYGTRVSMVLAPAAALLSTSLAAAIGGIAGLSSRYVQRSVIAITDLFLSLPWLFLLITVRAQLPLNISPYSSALVTFVLLGSLGWAASARVICADARTLRNANFVLLARTTGISSWRLFWRHILPNLKPALLAQFWISIPLYILTEANLGVLGLGVTEPLPSWGGLLRELEGASMFSPQPWLFAPLVLLILVVSCLHLALHNEEVSA
jgi:ABC-type dipeptide/oligopeptide/nickel transport system permease subunit